MHGVFDSPSVYRNRCPLRQDIAWALLGANYTSGIDAKEQIRITKHFIHPRFDEKTKEFDFAVHQLETPSQQTPVRVDWDDDIFTAPNTKAWIRGYGDTKLDGKRSETLLQTQVTIWPTSTCNDALREVDAATMLCAGGKNQDTCHGDSGGPLTVMINNHEELAGLTSWGLGCAKQGYPGVYARLSVAKNFVESIVASPDVQCTNRPSLA
ncbi:unnamed protein product [Aphanomyces euteiches]|uniref:Peptidase S1 domain-containing protein n=1 Tax=Aphanomyces euteiches TaxID=100861 RepID=A0A6G0WEP7_9STRA|nr:hypothetical protein Ae201684_016048 [Aphanomyces euteiches]KAH9078521.1 hypothetical protein Ae201684P_019604 [Aphanomyces euteiches]KAH9138395.1 hypothetical protein AeRB84_017293 [Aphanomyces euteiches]